MRKIIQIAGLPDIYKPGLFALCDDGTLWVSPLSSNGLTEWLQVMPIPAAAPALPEGGER